MLTQNSAPELTLWLTVLHSMPQGLLSYHWYFLYNTCSPYSLCPFQGPVPCHWACDHRATVRDLEEGSERVGGMAQVVEHLPSKEEMKSWLGDGGSCL
jgi:hypothetical protein